MRFEVSRGVESPLSGLAPRPDDVLLLVEVARRSLRYKGETQLPLHARAGAREVWIVDLAGNANEVHSDPVNGSYRCRDDPMGPATLAVDIPTTLA